MRKPYRRRMLILGVPAALALAIGGAAYAYFTTSGSGTGTATVGTNTAMTIQGSTTGTLYPGTSESVSFTVSNPSPGHQQLGTISLSNVRACVGTGSSWSGTYSAGNCNNSGTEASTCEDFSAAATNPTTTDFWMAPIVENQDVAGSSSNVAVTNGGTLWMNDLNSSQNPCENANLTLFLTS
jgi:hypothetical protein